MYKNFNKRDDGEIANSYHKFVISMVDFLLDEKVNLVNLHCDSFPSFVSLRVNERDHKFQAGYQ